MLVRGIDPWPNHFAQEPKHDTLDAAKLSLGEQLQRLEFRSPPAQPQPATLGSAARATLSFAQSRRAADNAWAAADKLPGLCLYMGMRQSNVRFSFRFHLEIKTS